MSSTCLRKRTKTVCLEGGERWTPEKEAGATMVRILDFNFITIGCIAALGRRMS